MLFAAEQVAGAADLEIHRREPHAAAEFGERLQRFEPLARVVREAALVAAHQQMAVRAMRRAADAAAQLVELREPEGLGAIDQHRVGARDVETALDDRRAQQQIRLAVQEAQHAILEIALVHLSVRHQHADLGHDALQHLRHLPDRMHAVVDEVDLPAASHLAQDRLAHHRFGEARHLRADRQPVCRRRVDHRHVAQAR